MQHTSDEIRLRLPAIPDYGRIARVAAASLAIRLDFSYREVEDLRIAVDEAMIALLGNETDRGNLKVFFHLDTGSLTIEASVEFTDEREVPSAEAAERFEQLVTGLVDEFDVDPSRNRISMTKAHQAG